MFRVFRSLRRFSSDIIDLTVPSAVEKAKTLQTSSKGIVVRPQEGALWGLDGQYLVVNKVKFKFGQIPSIKRLTRFLIQERCKDIDVIDITKYKPKHAYKICINATGYASRHLNRVIANLKKEFQEAKITEPIVSYSGRNDDWQCAFIKHI